MKKLIKMFKNLPPEFRMMLAMAGLGAPMGAIYLAKRVLFPNTPTLYIILGVAAVVGVISVIGFLLSKALGSRARKRSRQMEAGLASGAEGAPSGMEVGAQIKANNEKFQAALRDMRKETGTSVYDLPWYIVIGDSGCGKTKLINEGGLVFSLGKPEGYQLGTLDYNFWFTEDAVFVDMAGRLCNPQDDSDRREWVALLNTLSKYRKGFPINGAIVCVSAEHLLQDSPEQHEQDANTCLERLRDLQSKLGVTFATYLVITKCDKILGFMQLFDRAAQDITVKNQIFGWSKPGEFNELYDPDDFGETFNSLYERLNELRLRRLNDDADEIELGLAYSYPEEFRTLKEPLHTYVRTLFPAIRNPRGVKNLIFRGIYFTSATQKGGVILKHLAERLGEEAAGQFAPLEDLYPRPRPHFVKDLFFQKVFPEQGLVFRNEKQVARNRRNAKLAKVGSIALTLLLVSVIGWASYSFSTVIGEPREQSIEVRSKYVPSPDGDRRNQGAAQNDWDRITPGTAIKMAGAFGRYADLVKDSFARIVISLGTNADQPVQDLTSIRVQVFENSPLAKALREIDQALRDLPLETEADRKAYRDALEQYIVWHGCSDAETAPEQLTYPSFQTLCKVVRDPDSQVKDEAFLKAAEEHFSIIHDTTNSARVRSNPAALLRDPQVGIHPFATIEAAVQKLHDDYADHVAKLRNADADPVIREWMRIWKSCEDVESKYRAVLGDGNVDQITSYDAFTQFRTGMRENYGAFAKALAECTWKGERSGGKALRIKSLRDAIADQRHKWLELEDRLRDACKRCASSPDPKVSDVISRLSRGNPSQDSRPLDRVLFNSLQELELTKAERFPDDFGKRLKDYVVEVHERYHHILSFQPGDRERQTDDTLALTADVGKARDMLKQINEALDRAQLDPPKQLSSETAAKWLDGLEKRLYPKDETEAASSQPTPLAEYNDEWRGSDLLDLYKAHRKLIWRAEGTLLLRTIRARLDTTGDRGFGELYPDWRQEHPARFFYIPRPAGVADVRTRDTARPHRRATEETPSRKARRLSPRERRAAAAKRRPDAEREGQRKKRPAAPRRLRRPGTSTQKASIPQYANPDRFRVAARDCVDLLYFLEQFTAKEGFYYTAGRGSLLHEQCYQDVLASWKRYTDGYVAAWNAAYENAALEALDRVVDRKHGWEAFATPFRPEGPRASKATDEVAEDLRAGLAEILHAMRWPTFDPEQDRDALGDSEADFQPHVDAVEGAFGEAVDTLWKEPWKVRRVEPAAVRKKRNEAPWDALAGELGRRWAGMATKIGDNAHLPGRDEFRDGEDLAQQGEIPWGTSKENKTFRDLLSLAQFDGEHLTAKIVEFETQAKQLLTASLTRTLYAVQEGYFENRVPDEGWPYLKSGSDGGKTLLDTVSYDAFRKFLDEVAVARRVLAPLESSLATARDASWQARRAFYESCRQWRDDFLKLEKGNPSPLSIDIEFDDPMDPPFGKAGNAGMDDSAQLYYRAAELHLGLTLTADGGDTRVEPLVIPTERGERPKGKEVRWEWREPESDLTFRLVGGRGHPTKGKMYPDTDPLILGKRSALALCAYLHHYGRYDSESRAWIVAHAIDLRQEFEKKDARDLIPDGKPVVGAKFKFKLSRKMPDPIVKLQGTEKGAAPR